MVWKWWNHCSAEASAVGLRVLTVNMDETALCLFQGTSAGNLFIRKTERAVQRVPRSARRTFLTHVALICDDPAVQPFMPQIVVVNERTINMQSWRAVQASCPAGVRLVRQKSAWNNAELCARIVRWLAAAVAPFTSTTQVVLLFDAAKQHVTPQVLRACAAVKIWPIVIPAGLTWLLQPLDTHVFALYKIRLQKAYHTARIKTEDGHVAIAEFLPCVYAAISETLDGQDWSSAFERNGFSVDQAKISARVRKALPAEGAMHACSSRPIDAELLLCLPRRCKLDLRLFWKPFKSRFRPSALAPFGLAPMQLTIGCEEQPCPTGAEEPIAFRTRAGVFRMSKSSGSS